MFSDSNPREGVILVRTVSASTVLVDSNPREGVILLVSSGSTRAACGIQTPVRG